MDEKSIPLFQQFTRSDSPDGDDVCPVSSIAAPVRICMIMNPTVPYLTSKHRAETVPPESYRLMADVDAPLMKKVLNIAER